MWRALHTLLFGLVLIKKKLSINLQNLIEINWLILLVKKEYKNCRIKQLVVVFRKLKQSQKIDNDAARKLCSQSSQSPDC